MPGEVKILQFADGVETTSPITLNYAYYEEVTLTAEDTKEFDVSGSGITEAYKLVWQLKSATAPYTIQGGDVTHSDGTHVTFTFAEELTGDFILVGR